MASSDRHQETGSSIGRRKGVRWNPPAVPVVLRIPRLVEETEVRNVAPGSKAAWRRSEFRWPVGLGVGVLLLVAGIPWLIRWHPPANDSFEVLAPAVVVESDSETEILPPLYARTLSSPASTIGQLEPGSDHGWELLESLTVPHPSGGSQ
jgi:hypothetical protein